MDKIDFQSINSSKAQKYNRTNRYSNKYSAQTLERAPERDLIELKKEKQQKLHQRDKKNQMRGFIMGVALTLGAIGGGKAVVNNFSSPQTNFDAQGKTVSEAAEFCDIDPRAILIANDLDNENETVNDIILPQKYDVLDEKIEELEEDIKNSHSDEEIEELEEKLAELKDKKQLQDELAEVYVVEDGKDAYIIPNERGIMCEDIKEAFGIDDGVIRKHNNISYDWDEDENLEIHRGYMDYTNSSVPYEGIEIPKDELE